LGLGVVFLFGIYLGLLHAGHLPAWTGPLMQISFLFVTGILLARTRRLISSIVGEWLSGIGTMSVLLSFYQLHQGGSRIFEMTMLLGFCFIVLGLSRAEGWIGRGMSTRGMVYLGTISYSLYMTHTVTALFLKGILRAQNHMQGTLLEKGGVFILHLILLTLVAAVCYHGIEVPARERLRKISWGNSEK